MLDLRRKNLFDCRQLPHGQEVAVNRTELIDKVAEDTGLQMRKADEAVKAFIDTVMDEVRGGSKVSIFGFGTFTPTSRAARTGRNPQTGAPVKIAASKSVRFAPASAFKSSLNSRGGVKKAAAKKSAPKKAGATKSAAKKAGGAKKASKTAKR
jgi:DNA-binding protein HU-beta